MGLLAPLIEFLDVGFFRLLWALFVQYLVATNFLQPEQQQMWVDGAGHIISVAGTVIFLAIWQYKAHHKSTVKVTTKTGTQTIEETIENPTKIEDTVNQQSGDSIEDILEKYKKI